MERRTSKVTAEARLAGLPRVINEDYVVTKVADVPFEIRDSLLSSGMTSNDGVLWCSLCSTVINH